MKRRSVAGISGWPIHPSVTPDATKPVAWRQMVGWGYVGIAAIGPVISLFWCAWTGNSGETGGGNLPGELG